MEEIKSPRPTKQELIEMLDLMQSNIEGLPPAAMTLPINHYDFSSLLLLLSALFKAED